MEPILLKPSITKNDKKANWLIGIFSVVVFLAVVALGKYKMVIDPGFDVHIFAQINAVTNAIVALLLVAALVAVKSGNFLLHKKIMLAAMGLSVIFLLSYIAYHLMSVETRFGDIDHDGKLSDVELLMVGGKLTIYKFILGTHIVLAAIILPFILFTAYRGLTSEFSKHKKLAKYTWPLWLYVAVTGPIIYLMISPYYS